MGYGFDFQGASGKHYTFVLLDVDNATNLPMQGGIYVCARFENKPRPVFIGNATSIYGAMIGAPIWQNAKKHYGADRFYFHVSPDERKREAVVADLIASYNPQGNKDLENLK